MSDGYYEVKDDSYITCGGKTEDGNDVILRVDNKGRVILSEQSINEIVIKLMGALNENK